MRRWLSSILGLAVVSLATPPAHGQDKEPGSIYYPLKVGTQWHYQIAGKRITNRVAKHEKIGDVLCALIESSVDGNVVATEHISTAADGVYRHSIQGMKLPQPLCFLKLPPKDGATWKIDLTVGTEKLKGTFVTGKEEIKVPAGTFKTITAFTRECEVNGQKAVFKYWFAPNVGVVRQSISLGGVSFDIELVKYEPAK